MIGIARRFMYALTSRAMSGAEPSLGPPFTLLFCLIAALSYTIGFAPDCRAHRSSVPVPGAASAGSMLAHSPYDGKLPFHLTWGTFTVVVEQVITNPDNPSENYQQLSIVESNGTTVRTIREARITDVQIVRFLGDPTGELWFQATAGGHDELEMCGAFTQIGDLHNILLARDVSSVKLVLLNDSGETGFMANEEIAGPFISPHENPSVSQVYRWNGKRFALATGHYPRFPLAAARRSEAQFLDEIHGLGHQQGYDPREEPFAVRVAEQKALQYLANMSAAGRKAAAIIWLGRHAPPVIKRWLADNQSLVMENERTIREPRSWPLENSRIIDDVN